MFNNVISIPVHEKTEVVIDQIFNYKFFCPNCGIVLHISKSFNWQDSFHNEKEFRFLLSQFENVFVNPKSLNTLWGDIIHAHILNFEYISQVADFEYFSMGSSNDLFIRRMPNFKNFDASFSGKKFNAAASADDEIWYWDKQCRNDKYLMEILKSNGATLYDVIQSQIEGSCYSKTLFQEIVTAIKKHYGENEVSDKNKVIYPREEVYFPTLANLFNKNGNLKFNDNNYTFIAWGKPGMIPTVQEITDIANGKMEGKYSIKRVLRTLDDKLRVAVGTQIGNYRAQALDFIKNTIPRTYLKFFNLTAGRKRIFIGFEKDRDLINGTFDAKFSEIFLPLNVQNNVVNLQNIADSMRINSECLFVICVDFYPQIANFLTQTGFRENVDFINGTLFLP